MPNTRDLRRRIKSVKNTSQITKAMQMVSATKMRRAQNQALSARSYTKTLAQILSQAAYRFSTLNHPLIQSNQSTKVGVVFLTTDKGLCGSLNTNLTRILQVSPLFSGHNSAKFYTVGKKGRDFIVRANKDLQADFPNLERVEFKQAATLRKALVTEFLSGEIGEAYLVYPHFLSTLRQEPKVIRILPIDQQALNEFLSNQDDNSSKSEADYLFEPTLSEVLEYALEHFLDTQIYQALLETKASEHSARMIAMQNATNNAKELVTDLQLEYNQARQSAITTQILEIASAGAALE